MEADSGILQYLHHIRGGLGLLLTWAIASIVMCRLLAHYLCWETVMTIYMINAYASLATYFAVGAIGGAEVHTFDAAAETVIDGVIEFLAAGGRAAPSQSGDQMAALTTTPEKGAINPASPEDLLAEQMSRLSMNTDSLLGYTLDLPREIRTLIYKLLPAPGAFVPCRTMATPPAAMKKIMSICPQFRAEIMADWYQIVGLTSTICMDLSRDDLAWTTSLPTRQYGPIGKVKLTNLYRLNWFRNPETRTRTALGRSNMTDLQAFKKLEHLSLDLGCIEGVIVRANGGDDRALTEYANYRQAQDRNTGYARLLSIVLAALPRLPVACQLEITATLGKRRRDIVRPHLPVIKLEYSAQRPERLQITEEWFERDLAWPSVLIRERVGTVTDTRVIRLGDYKSS